MFYSKRAPKEMPISETNAGKPKLGMEDPAPDAGLVAAPALICKSVERTDGKTRRTHALVTTLTAELTALVADPNAPVACDTTEEAPDVALSTAPDAPLEAAEAAEETPLEAADAPEVAALWALVAMELASDMTDEAPSVALLDALAIADDALALAEASKKVTIVS